MLGEVARLAAREWSEGAKEGETRHGQFKVARGIAVSLLPTRLDRRGTGDMDLPLPFFDMLPLPMVLLCCRRN